MIQCTDMEHTNFLSCINYKNMRGVSNTKNVLLKSAGVSKQDVALIA
jgi:hypothetical protein